MAQSGPSGLSLETRVHMSVPLLLTYVSYIKAATSKWYLSVVVSYQRLAT